MKKCYLKIDLIDDVVLSADTSTLGSHISFDFIPGSVLLGAVASKLYSQMKDEKNTAWDVFHSGNVRFENGYLFKDKPSIPVPLSYHFEKGKSTDIIDFTKENKQDGIQYKQHRFGYFNECGKIENTRKFYRMRTAIDSKLGSAKEGQLFGFQSITGGQSFLSSITWDEKCDESVKKILVYIKANPVFRMGRSKKASYGRVKITVLDTVENKAIVSADKELSFIALSDLLLRDRETGTPTFEMKTYHIGLPENWEVVRSKTFTKTRSAIAWNNSRPVIYKGIQSSGGYEPERYLISKGSVFTFRGQENLSPQEIEKVMDFLSHGSGDGLEHGYGKIALSNYFDECSLDVSDPISQVPLSRDQKNWLEWVESHCNTDNERIEEVKESLLKSFKSVTSRIMKFNGFSSTENCVPASTQWQRVKENIDKKENIADLKTELFEMDNAVISERPEKDPIWNMRASLDENDTIRNWFQIELEKYFTDPENIAVFRKAFNRFIKEIKGGAK